MPVEAVIQFGHEIGAFSDAFVAIFRVRKRRRRVDWRDN
jgi:hypothetical protein